MPQILQEIKNSTASIAILDKYYSSIEECR